MRIYWIAAILAVTLASCEGPMGPAGEQGETGAQGAQGVQGLPGADAEPNESFVYHFHGRITSSHTSIEVDGHTAYAGETPTITLGISDAELGPYMLTNSVLVVHPDNALGIFFGASNDGDILIEIICGDPTIIGMWYSLTVIVPPA